jgi:hypothetical protein
VDHLLVKGQGVISARRVVVRITDTHGRIKQTPVELECVGIIGLVPSVLLFCVCSRSPLGSEPVSPATVDIQNKHHNSQHRTVLGPDTQQLHFLPVFPTMADSGSADSIQAGHDQ